MDYIITRSDDYLAHHGVKGQRWGVRNFQNPDGSLTAEGERRRMKAQRIIDKEEPRTAHTGRRVVLGGVAGAGATAAVGAGAATAAALSAYAGAGGTLASLNFGALGAIAASGAAVTLPLLGIAAIGGMTIAALRAGHRAKKIKKAREYLDSINIK